MHLQPNRISKTRRADIREFLAIRNATTGQITRRFFPGESMATARKRACRFLAKERKRGRVRLEGMILMSETGRPELVYGKPSKGSDLEHEVLITEVELSLNELFQRNVPVGKTIADGMLIRKDAKLFIEVDNETMSIPQMREKWQRYGDIDGFILLICRTTGRLRRLMKSADRAKHLILFSRFEWLRMENVKAKWIDWYGKRAEI